MTSIWSFPHHEKIETMRLQTQGSLMLESQHLLQPKATTVVTGDPEIPTCTENIKVCVLLIQKVCHFR